MGVTPEGEIKHRNNLSTSLPVAVSKAHCQRPLVADDQQEGQVADAGFNR
jgi:hypothetical protein